MAAKYHATGKALDLTTDPTVPKPIGIVELAGGRDLTLHDRRLWDTLLALAYERVDQDVEHTVAMADLRRLAKGASAEAPHQGNERLKSSLKRLKSLVLEFDALDSDGDKWTYLENLLGSTRFSERRDILFYKFPEPMRPLLVDPAIHARIRLAVVYQFESKYSLILYEILQRHADRRAASWDWAVELKELRALLGVEKKFPNFADLDKRAIAPAKTEIDAHSDFTVEYAPVRAGGTSATRGRGSRVVSVVFTVRRKDADSARKTAKLNDRTKPEKRAAKKGNAAQSDLVVSVTALKWLEVQDVGTRLRWAKRAEELGIKLPVAASAKDNLPKWVPFLADEICREEGLH